MDPIKLCLPTGFRPSKSDSKFLRGALKTLETLRVPVKALPTAKRDGCGWGAERTNRRSYRVYRESGFRMIGRLHSFSSMLVMVVDAIFSDGDHSKYRAYIEKHLNGGTARRSTRRSKARAKRVPVEPEVIQVVNTSFDVFIQTHGLMQSNY